MLAATGFIAASTLQAKTTGADLPGPPLHPLQISNGRFIFAFALIGSAALHPRASKCRFYVTLIFAALFDMLIFNQTPDWTTRLALGWGPLPPSPGPLSWHGARRDCAAPGRHRLNALPCSRATHQMRHI